MLDDNLKSLLRNIDEGNKQDIEKTKENNKTLKNRILQEIEQVINYLEELKGGKHIDYLASDKYPDLFELNKHLISGCVNQADRLKSLFERIDTDRENLKYLGAIFVALNNIEKEYDEENYYLMPNDLAVSLASLNAIETFILAYKNDKDKYNIDNITTLTPQELESEILDKVPKLISESVTINLLF